ncbi:MAG: threonine--tRNA ligase [Deltaproteobacteria bacterium]|nr:threonine--tRNA ligase [Deltaproteobacteria bacterium]
MIKVQLDQGPAVEMPAGVTAAQALQDLQVKTDRRVLAARVDGELVDLSQPLDHACTIAPVPLDSPEGLELLRHSAAHIMAEAVRELFPGAKVAIGPAIENGFYYDFDVPEPFTPEDLEKIEERMRQLVKQDQPFLRAEESRAQAIENFKAHGEVYKVELLEGIDQDKVSLYHQGNFIDLCRGPHIPSTGFLKAFKLTSTSGAYWRGDEHRPMLQRIYGTAFATPKELKQYLEFLEEAKRRDHRRLGRELGLFSIEEEAGAGMVIYHPKGALLRSLIEDFERREHFKRGYQMVMGPQMLKADLWKRSGHWDNYRDNMYFADVEGTLFGIKPMNCVAHMLIYRSSIRSYRELPLRFFELGTVMRHERSGVLHGLTRVRQFTQDDAHIICTPEQVESEIVGVLDFVFQVMAVFGFEYEMELSTRPEKSIGSDAEWELATNALIKAMEAKKLPYHVCEGEGAFYGPKIDIKLKDAINRRWQCATIQCDFTLPERFDLTYVGDDGGRHRPVMLHRVILGSLERFIGVLIEHYAGAFPVWLAPVQAVLLPITDRVHAYAGEITAAMRAEGLRVEIDARPETLRYKIREAQLQKIPYMIVIGDREAADRTLSPRLRDGTELKDIPVEAFINRLKEESRLPSTM